jgi:ribose transport system ATP-binding protein
LRGEGESSNGDPLLRLSSIAKRYGNTQALAGVDLVIERGEILGIVGHNGAGKSTLMRVVLGITRPDSGSIEFGHEVLGPSYSLAQAYARGVRIVFQELALCPSLRVFENVYLARPALRGRGWRRRSREVIVQSLEDVFPGSRTSARAVISKLPLARRQMVEIAQAAIGGAKEVSLLVLDEPTSALSRESAEQLFDFLRRLRAAGVSTIVISHRMQEVLANTDRTVVMRDGKVVGTRISNDTGNDEILALMGAAPVDAVGALRKRQQVASDLILEVHQLSTRRLHGISFKVRQGEVVGFAGLDGQGQHELLLELWRRRRRRRWRGRAMRCRGEMAFLTGDRQTAGVFPLWDLRRNASVSALGEISSFGVLRTSREIALVDRWITRLAIRGRRSSGILELSGGTQQKVLVARALATKADLVLLDDPFRGVDVATKHETYRLIDEEAAKGRAFIWFSTENAELEESDRVYVLRGGRIVAELAGDEAREDRVIAASFGSDLPAPGDDETEPGGLVGSPLAAPGGPP